MSRQSELEAAQRPGRMREEIKEMKVFHDLFHSELDSLSPQNDANRQKLQRTYSLPHSDLCAALDMQNVIINHMKRMSTMETETCIDDMAEQRIKDAQPAAASARVCMD